MTAQLAQIAARIHAHRRSTRPELAGLAGTAGRHDRRRGASSSASRRAWPRWPPSRTRCSISPSAGSARACPQRAAHHARARRLPRRQRALRRERRARDARLGARASVGDPVEDLGWLCTRAWRFGSDALPAGGIGTREELLAAYRAAGGGEVDPEHLRFWEAMGSYKVALVFIQQSWVYLSGKVPVARARLARPAHRRGGAGAGALMEESP